MDVQDEELLAIWKELQLQGVRYIMVGGFATSFHGFSRFTGDCDVWLQDTKENRKNFGLAISNLGLGESWIVENMEFIAGWTTFRLASGMELDVMTSLKNYTQLDFDECHRLAVRAEILNVEIPFLHINHLIAEKRATGRSKDIIDADELERIRERQGREK